MSKFKFSESVRNGQFVVNLIDSCIKTLAEKNVERLLGYTSASMVSDSAFVAKFFYQGGKDISRSYTLISIEADPAAQIDCFSMDGDQKKTIKDKNLVLSRATAITCTKASGKSVSGTFKFVAADKTERLVDFTVTSPEGEEIVREKIRGELEQKVATRASRLTRKIDDSKAELDKRLGEQQQEIAELKRQINAYFVALTSTDYSGELIDAGTTSAPGNTGGSTEVKCQKGMFPYWFQMIKEGPPSQNLHLRCARFPALTVK